MIYLNNAGTTWPKPDSVNEALHRFGQLSPDDWLHLFKEGQWKVTDFFGIQDPERFLFTQSCTQSLAVAFSDFLWKRGDRLAISSMEHHALSHWMYKLQNEQGIEGVVVPRYIDGPLDLGFLENELKKGLRMVAITMASNVTGEILPYEDVVRLAKRYNAHVLLDGAQVAGILPIDLAELDPDIFVFAGHKGPFGTQGIGGLYIGENIAMSCPSAVCEIDPDKKSTVHFPTYCDTGSAPMITIAGLSAGIDWLNKTGWDELVGHRKKLTQMMRQGLESIPGIKMVGSTTWGKYTGAVSITSDTYALEEIKSALWQKSSIKGNLGFQCAPLAHEALGTSETGTLRFSVGPFNSEKEISILLEGLQSVVAL